MARLTTKRESDDSLSIRAAWLHYAAGMTQADIATRLRVSGVKAHRLISRANENGAVKVSIDGDVTECTILEHELAAKYKLTYSQVVPDLHEEGLPLRALGMAGADFFMREIESGQAGVIGVGHGRTIAAAVARIRRLDTCKVKFVSLLGGLTRNYAANPHDVMYRLAEKTGATAFVMPVPFFANTVEDREVFLAQRGVTDVLNLAANADLMIVGIGTPEPDGLLVATQMIDTAEIGEIKQLGGVGEMLGHFFNADGKPIEATISSRTVSLELDRIKGRRIVAIAGGKEKTCAIRSLLMSHLLNGLITDERTAFALLDEPPGLVG